MSALPKTQQELLDALRAGVVVGFMPYRGRFGDAYYFRHDNFQRVTAAAFALVKKGLVVRYDDSWRGHKIRPIDAPPARGAS